MLGGSFQAIALTAKDKEVFDIYYQFIQDELGDIPMIPAQARKTRTKANTVKTVMQILHKYLTPILFENNSTNLTKENADIIYGLVFDLFRTIMSARSDLKAKQTAAYLDMLFGVVANNLLYKLLAQKSGVNNKSKILHDLSSKYVDSYDTLDQFLSVAVDQSPYLGEFRQNLFNQLYALYDSAGSQDLTREEILFHLSRKNQRAKATQSAFNAQLIDNPNSVHVVRMDIKVLNALMQAILSIKSKALPRSQFMVRVCGLIGHVVGLDVAFNQSEKCFEIICVESAQQKLQWELLFCIAEQLTNLNENFKIVAIQSGFQKAARGCPIFTLSLMARASNQDFSDLLKRAKADDFDSANITFFDKFEVNDPKLRDLPPIPCSIWAHVSILGLTAQKQAQSATLMKENLTRLAKTTSLDVNAILRQWEKAYEWDKSMLKSYYEYRQQSLLLKYQGKLFSGLNSEHILDKLKEDSEKSITIEKGIQRLAAGRGPKRDMECLIAGLESQGQLNRLNIADEETQRTALHWALLSRHFGRTCLLLQKGAVVDHPDKEGRTESDYFAEINDPCFKNNEYLKQKFRPKS